MENNFNENLNESSQSDDFKLYTLDTLSSKLNNQNYKKFVIQIDNDNVDYFESFSPSERTKLINKFLSLEQIKSRSDYRKKRIKEYIIHLTIVIVSIFVFLPFFYYTVNKLVLLTLENYKQTQINFEKLYNDNSLKKKDLTKLKYIK
ncbi:MAG: hypothetical protein BHW64_00635 [Candidatus Melainabacteria bacterium LEY3_CP_29_8]|nr:MAG: hypothetical protein BHW64_00635 [Candidatus Melainabacteria bacterium LEY3_CP_29_8]